MDDTKAQHEKAVGDEFVRWFNEKNNTDFVLKGQAGDGPGPDLAYSAELRLEVTDAYYDDQDAKFLWKNARKAPDAPQGWQGTEFDKTLLDQINKRLEEKCLKSSYGPNCILVINMQPSLTTAEELESMLPNVKLPQSVPFVGIYLTGNFPSSVGSAGGYRCWRLIP
jgi:hypothetical protein